MEIIKPKAITKNSTVGIFTPSFPAHVAFRDKYLHGLSELKRIGFNVIEGSLTKKAIDHGYRSGSPQKRADEFMELINNPEVDFLMATIGGNNSSSMLELLNYETIRKERKIITGYSDVTSLHMAIYTQAGLSTFYGPAVVPTFGEWPKVFPESLDSFFHLASQKDISQFELPFFPKWSNHFRDAENGDWKNIAREWNDNSPYPILNAGKVTGKLMIANINTLCCVAGSIYFPDFTDKILLLEQMSVSFANEERMLYQLKNAGVFKQIKGLIIGKPEFLDTAGADFSNDELIQSIIGDVDYPVITGFDCSHTHPMHTLAQDILVEFDTKKKSALTILESAVE